MDRRGGPQSWTPWLAGGIALAVVAVALAIGPEEIVPNLPEEPCGVIHGTVWRGEQPAAARVELWFEGEFGDSAEGIWPTRRGVWLTTLEAGEDGEWRFEGLEPGRYGVRAQDERGLRCARAGFVWAHGSHDRVELVLPSEPATFRGRILHDDGSPYVGPADLWEGVSFTSMTSTGTVETSEDGSFEVTWGGAPYRTAIPLEDGRVLLSGVTSNAVVPKERPSRIRVVDGVSGEPLPAATGFLTYPLLFPLLVQADEDGWIHVPVAGALDIRHTGYRSTGRVPTLDLDGSTIALWPDPDPEEEPVALPPSVRWSGIVRDADGRPAEGCTVAALRNGRWYRTATDARGAYALVLPPGLAPTWVLHWVSGKMPDAMEHRGRNSHRRDFRLPPSRLLRISAEVGGRPLVGASVAAASWEGTTDRRGLAFARGIAPPLPFAVVLQSRDGLRTSQMVSGDAVDVHFEVEAPLPVRVRVPPTLPMEVVVVEGRPVSAEGWTEAYPSGWFESISGTATWQGASYDDMAEPPFDEPILLELEREYGLLDLVRLTELRGFLLHDYELSLTASSSDDEWEARNFSGARGVPEPFTGMLVLEGPYFGHVIVHAEEARFPLHVRVGPARTLEGRLTDINGDPVSRTSIEVFPLGPRAGGEPLGDDICWVSTGPDGRFVLSGLGADQHYRIVATHDEGVVSADIGPETDFVDLRLTE